MFLPIPSTRVLPTFSVMFMIAYHFFCFTSHNISLALINACNNNTHWEVFRKATVQEITLRRRGEHTENHLCVSDTNLRCMCHLTAFSGLKAVVCFRSLGAQSHFTFSCFCSCPWLQGDILSFNIQWHLQSKEPGCLLSQNSQIFTSVSLRGISRQKTNPKSKSYNFFCIFVLAKYQEFDCFLFWSGEAQSYIQSIDHERHLVVNYDIFIYVLL